MNLISITTDKYISNRLEGLDPSAAFVLAKLEAHRYLADFVYFSNAPMSDEFYSDLIFILEDIRFTQSAEISFQSVRNRQKNPAV